MTPETTEPVGGPSPDSTSKGIRPWAERLALLAEQLATPLDEPTRAAVRGELWLLLSAALARFARAQVRTLGSLTREDLEDLVATKALDLLHRIESGSLVLRRDSARDVSGFVAQTSRNAIIDHLRRERTRRGGNGDAQSPVDVAELAAGRSRDAIPPSNRVEFAEVTTALELCIETLAPRARRIWIFRTFFDMSSRDIAAHPDIRVTPANVDVIVGRARTALRACLEKGGVGATDLAVAGMARLWDRFVRAADRDGDGQ